MKKMLLPLLLLLCVHAAQATAYYFSSVNGDDSRSPAQAQNQATPWKSLEQFNAFNRYLLPGDSVLFNRGETFYGSITVKSRGTAGGIIYYGAYGSGANPVISGFTTVAGWTQQSPGIYWAPLEAANLNMVTINGVAKGMGRYPNSGFLKYESHNGNQSITDNELPAAPNWTGAEIVVRKYRFILDRHIVTSHAGTTLNYSTSGVNGNNSAYAPVSGNGYFFQGHLQTLDQFGEWYYDTAAKRLYVYFGANAPASYVVKASTKDYNAVVSTAYFLKFENLDFEGANAKGLYLINTSYTLVQACNFYNQGGTSLYGIDLNAVTVNGGSINTSFSNGISFENNASNCTIDGVSVFNTNTVAGTGRSGSGVGIGILAAGENITITNNRVQGAGYNGIQFIGNNVLVEKNLVDSFCLLKDDGGGIYTYTGATNDSNYNRIIRSNIVLNAVGAKAGTDAYYYEPFGKAAGIYLDEFANGVEITGNTIANGDWAGIFLHDAHSNRIKNNLIYNHRYQVHVSQSATATRNNLMIDNQYIAKQAFQTAFNYQTTVSDSPAAMGTFNYNVYARPLSDNQTIELNNFYAGGSGTTQLTLAQWKVAYNLDSSSQKSPITYASNIDDNLRFEYNATATNRQVMLASDYIDVKNNHYSGTLTLAPFTGLLLLKSSGVVKQAQTINFAAVAAKTFGDAPFAISGTASSGLPVSYRVVNGPATVSGATVMLLGPGTVTLCADQPGDETYYAAGSVYQSFAVALNPAPPPAPKTAQTINFGTLPYKTWGVPPITLMGTASSGLPVAYKIVSGPAVLTNRTVTLIGVGTVTIEASQPGNDKFNAAAPVTRSFGVGKSNQSITFPGIPNKFDSDPPFALTATATSGSAVAYRVVSGPATVVGNIVTITGTGTITIEASQAGNELTNPAYPLQRSFAVTHGSGKASQTINFGSLANKTYGDPPFVVSASASSGLPVGFRIVSGPATISGNTVTLTGVGTVVVEASQPGDANYLAATAVTQSFVVGNGATKSSQTISFGTLAYKTYTSAAFDLNATASSGLPVSYRVVSGPITIAGTTVTITGVGAATVEASQAGNDSYNAAMPIQRSFTIGKASQIITFGALSNKVYGDPPFNLNATASSGLGVSYRVVSGPASVSGASVTLTGAGAVTIEASQTGNANFNPANVVSRSFAVTNSGARIKSRSVAERQKEVAVGVNEIAVYPNPLRGEGTIRLQLSQTAVGTIGILDKEGKMIKQVGRYRLAGGNPVTVKFNATGLAAGSYILQVTVDGITLSKAFVVVK